MAPLSSLSDTTLDAGRVKDTTGEDRLLATKVFIWQDTIPIKFDRTKIELAELRMGCTERIDQQISINHVKDKQTPSVSTSGTF